MKIKYHHLWAWDTMMASYPYWKEQNQRRARKEKAPIDAVYKNGKGEWVRFKDIESEDTKKRIKMILEKLM